MGVHPYLTTISEWRPVWRWLPTADLNVDQNRTGHDEDQSRVLVTILSPGRYARPPRGGYKLYSIL
jgi:hypothetical protein